MYYDFVIHCIVVLFLCGVIILLESSLKRKYSHYLLGVMFGLITIFVISSGRIDQKAQFFDFRHITMTMAGFIGGPVTAVIAAIISSTYRYTVGGSGSMGGIASIIVFGFFGSILGSYLRSRQNGKKVLFWFLIGFIMSVMLLLTIAITPPRDFNFALVRRIASGPFLIITPLATTIIFNFYYWAYKFFGKATILNTILNFSPINLMIYDSNGPILLSKNIEEQNQLTPYIENSHLLLDIEKARHNSIAQQAREIATENGAHFVADLSSFQMPSGEYACVAIVNDVTNRKREQEALKVANERFSKAFQLGPHMMTIIRMRDNKYVEVNQRFLETKGLTREDVIGKTPNEIGVLGNEFKEIIDILVQQGSVKNIQYPLMTKYGINAVIISAEKIHIDDQECILLAYNDVTEMKRMQMEREEQLTKYLRLESEISRLDRLNLVGQLAAGIGHEIRNPMTTVRGYLQLLGEKSEYGARKPTFDLMISELDRANSIISEFLSLARTKQTELKSQNLNDIIKNLYPLLEADAFNQNKQICYIPGETPDLELNGNEISQLVLNFTRNGLEAMKENGCLTLKVYLEEGKVVLAIQDEGCGIPPKDLIKLGTPFFTTKESGTGLGLATCYKIAESHNAKIHINSSPNGTTFLIDFPIAERDHKQNKIIA